MSQLADALFSETRQRVLGLLYGHPERSFFLKEILRLTGMGVATIKRDLDRMVAAGILTRTEIGNQHHYQANPACPIFEELATIVYKTVGIVEPIREAIAPLSGRIDQAFVFGSLAGGTDSPPSDIDLMVIGKIGYAEVVKALYPVQERLGREINPKVYSSEQWSALLAKGDRFVRDVMNKPRIEITGQHE